MKIEWGPFKLEISIVDIVGILTVVIFLIELYHG